MTVTGRRALSASLRLRIGCDILFLVEDRRARIIEELRATLAELSDGTFAPASIDPSAPLFDFGYVDSLAAVVLIERVRASYGVTISEVDLVGRCHTLDALATFIAAQRVGG